LHHFTAQTATNACVVDINMHLFHVQCSLFLWFFFIQHCSMLIENDLKHGNKTDGE